MMTRFSVYFLLIILFVEMVFSTLTTHSVSTDQPPRKNRDFPAKKDSDDNMSKRSTEQEDSLVENATINYNNQNINADGPNTAYYDATIKTTPTSEFVQITEFLNLNNDSKNHKSFPRSANNLTDMVDVTINDGTLKRLCENITNSSRTIIGCGTEIPGNNKKPRGFSPLSSMSSRERTILKATMTALVTYYGSILFIVGITVNVMNLIVLRSAKMRQSSSNVYLTALAFCDLMYLTCRSPTVIKTYFAVANETYLAFYRVFMYVGFTLTGAMICASEWVTAAFTIERYIAVCHPIKAQLYCTTRRAKWVSAAILLLSVLINLEKPLRKHPHYIYHPVTKKLMDVQLLYTDIGVIPEVNDFSVIFALVFVGFLPISLIGVFNIFLIRSIKRSSQNRKQLTSAQQSTRNKEFFDVTKMLVVVISLFFVFCSNMTLVRLLASGYVGQFEGTFGFSMYKLLSLTGTDTNATINFFIYNAFSKQFRDTLRRLWSGKDSQKKSAPSRRMMATLQLTKSKDNTNSTGLASSSASGSSSATPSC